MLLSGLGSGRSTIDPGIHAWSAQTADELHRLYTLQPDESNRKFLEKLADQLEEASDAAILLTAEFLTLHQLPVGGLTDASKRDPSGIWREETVALPEAVDLLTGVAEVFARLVARALRQGVLQGYRTVTESSLTFRGRLREAEQLRRHFGMTLPAEVIYDEYSSDIAENQLLKAALWLVLAIPGVPDLTRGRLLRLRARLADVSDLVPGARLPDWRLTRLNARYEPALRLAELILRSASFDLGRGQVPATGFLVSMPSVFEGFVTVAMGRELVQRFEGEAWQQDRRWSLDEAETVDLRPDLVWDAVPGRPAAVIDAKYKAESVAGFPNADMYQMLAYCSALRVPVGHLVYAAGSDAVRGYRLPHGIEVVAHVLDLNADPDGLLRQVGEIAEKVAGVRKSGDDS